MSIETALTLAKSPVTDTKANVGYSSPGTDIRAKISYNSPDADANVGYNNLSTDNTVKNIFNILYFNNSEAKLPITRALIHVICT